MATLNISGGTTITGLTAGTAAEYQVVSVLAAASEGGAPGELDDFTVLNGGSITVKGIASNGMVLDGRVDISSGGIISGGTASGGKLYIKNGGVFRDGTMAAGDTVQVLNGGVLAGGTVIDGTVRLSSGGIASDCTVQGGKVMASSCGLFSGGVILGGAVSVYSKGQVSGGTIAGGTMRVFQDTTVSGIAVTNGALQVYDFTGTAGRPQAIVTGVEQTKGSIILRGTNISGYDFRLSGGTTTVQNGAYLSGGTVGDGGSLVFNTSSGTNIIDDQVGASGADITLIAGRVDVSSGCIISGGTASGGKLYIKNGGVFRDGTMAAGDTVQVLNGGVLAGGTVTGGTVRLSRGGIASDCTVRGGQVMASDGGLFSGGMILGGVVYVYSNGLVSGGTIAGGAMRVSQGTTVSGIAVTNGALQVYDYTGAADRPIAIVTDAEQTNGSIILRGTNISGYDFRLFGGTTTVQNGAYLSGGTVGDGGTLVFNTSSGANIIDDNFTASGADITVLSGGTMKFTAGIVSNTTIAGGVINLSSGAEVRDLNLTEATGELVVDGGLASGGTMTAGTISVLDGVVSNVDVRNGSLLISGGRVDLPSGGTFSGNLTFDLTGKTGQATALLTGAANLSGAAISILADTETIANYVLADGELGAYTINGASRTSGTTYNDFTTGIAYKLAGGTLSVAEYVEPEVDPAASIIAAANAVVDVATGGTVYTGRINGGSTTVTGQYFAAGTDTGSKDLLLEVTNGINTGIIAAGANAGGAVGTGKVKVTGGSTLLLLGGGNTGATQSKAVVEVAGGEVGTLYGGGKQGGYADGIDVTLTGTATVNNIYAGVLHTSGTGNFTIGGEINLDIDAGAVTGFVFGGGKVSVSGSESVTFNNDINITVDGGTFGSGVYALGYAKGTDKTKTALTMASTQEVAVTISGGTFNSNVYLGALTDTAITSGASLTATVTGGKISGLYGGGLAQRGGTANAGAVTISVSGGEIDALIGGGSHVNKDDGNATTVDSVAINVSGGSIGSIYAGGHYNDTLAGYYGSDTVTHDAVLTLSGDAEVGKAAGSWRGLNTVGGQRKLVFDDFTGTCGTVCDWDLVTFDGENATTADLSSATVYGVGAWSFDVIGREANAGTALVNIGDWFGGTATIDLHITDAATSLTTWSLAEFNGSLGDLTFNVYNAASTELASGLALEEKITTGTFTNYGFSVDDATNTLQFGLLSA